MDKILLKKELGENILTRNSLSYFFKKKIDSSKSDELVLDFKGIKFISRSCAAEYIKLRENSNKVLIEKNMSNEIRAMFYVIIKQLKNSKFNFKKEIQLTN